MLLPLFPLGLVVFPKEKLHLHIFEPRYRALIHEAESEGIKFGIPYYEEGFQMEIGTEIELVKIAKRYTDGKMDIVCRGLRVFKINNFHSTMMDKLYAGGEVEYLDNVYDGDIVIAQKILEHTAKLYKVMNIKKPLPPLDDDFSVFQLAHKIGLTSRQENELLSLTQEADRQSFVLDHLEHMLPMIEQMENMRKKIQMNGHFKNIIPPEL